MENDVREAYDALVQAVESWAQGTEFVKHPCFLAIYAADYVFEELLGIEDEED